MRVLPELIVGDLDPSPCCGLKYMSPGLKF